MEPKYKVTVRFTDDKPAMVVHFDEPKLSTIGVAPGLGNTYENPVSLAHKFAGELTTKGSSVRMHDAVIYIPVHRVRDAVVEKKP